MFAILVLAVILFFLIGIIFGKSHTVSSDIPNEKPEHFFSLFSRLGIPTDGSPYTLAPGTLILLNLVGYESLRLNQASTLRVLPDGLVVVRICHDPASSSKDEPFFFSDIIYFDWSQITAVEFFKTVETRTPLEVLPTECRW